VDPHATPDEPLLSDTELLLEARRRLDALLVRNLQSVHTRDVAVELRGKTTKWWLVAEQRLAGADAAQLLKVATALPFRPALADALASGAINVAHAAPIVKTLTKLHPEERDVSEKILLEASHDLDPDVVKRLCGRTLEASAAADTADERRERTHSDRYLTVVETWLGMTRIEGMLTAEQGAALRAVLEPLAVHLGPEDDRTGGQRRADALGTLATAALGFDGLLPEFNGEQPHVNAVMQYDPLVDALRPFADKPVADDGGFTINGTALSPQTARMLACDAQIIPVVMRGGSEVLDIGRSSRTWTKAIRKALQLEDNGCGWPDCQMPLWACRIHHLLWWNRDHGPTSKANGVHLCNFHHWLVHNKPWKIWRNEGGHIEVARTSVSRT
jgi:hypothetical protein